MKPQLLFNDKHGETISVPLDSLEEWCYINYPNEAVHCKTEEEYISILHRHYHPIFRCESV